MVPEKLGLDYAEKGILQFCGIQKAERNLFLSSKRAHPSCGKNGCAKHTLKSGALVKKELRMQIKEIFVIRCLSCLSVVLLHVVSMVLMIQEESLASAAHTVDAFRTLLMFSTPAFIFISEFLLARSYPGGVPAGF